MPRSPRLTALVASVGKRNALVRCIRESARDLALDLRVVTTDASPLAPASYESDDHVLVPRIEDARFAQDMLDVIESHEVDLVIPTIDTELGWLASTSDALSSMGVTAAISSEEAVTTALDKLATAKYLREKGLPAPATWDEPPTEPTLYPIVAKPRQGSSSVGISLLSSPADDPGGDLVYQHQLVGPEYTVDLYVDRSGCPLATCVRERLAVRAGEVNKARTVVHEDVTRLATEVADELPGAW
ncbi:unnamed protein product, partial [marine sediment metagenome]